MRAVIQRVSRASVTVQKEIVAETGKGLVVFVGIEAADNQEDTEWLCNKIIQLRIFEDKNGVMNLSVKDTGGEIIVVRLQYRFMNSSSGGFPDFLKKRLEQGNLERK
jgi:D-tyrosyl-tRNA(Tyr) deacylase